MNWNDYLTAVASDSDLIAAAARKSLDADVPACPGWTVRDVVAHTGRVHREKEQTVRERHVEEFDGEYPVPPDDELADWFSEGASQLVETLAAADPATTAWTWLDDDQTVGFWYRRMAQETLIHRVDAEQAHGSISPIDSDLAADGADEMLMTFLEGFPPWSTVEPGEQILKLSIPGRDWFFRRDEWGGTTRSGRVFKEMPAWMAVEQQVNADCTISGSPQALDLWLWGRGSIDDVAVEGDDSLAAELRQDAAESTQ